MESTCSQTAALSLALPSRSALILTGTIAGEDLHTQTSSAFAFIRFQDETCEEEESLISTLCDVRNN